MQGVPSVGAAEELARELLEPLGIVGRTRRRSPLALMALALMV